MVTIYTKNLIQKEVYSSIPNKAKIGSFTNKVDVPEIPNIVKISQN